MKRWLGWLVGLFVALLWLTAVSPPAAAQTPVLTSSAEPVYGQSVTFRLMGQIATEIEQIELFVSVAQADTPLMVAVRFTQDSAGQLVAGYNLDPSLAKLPPFAEVRFWWALKTAVSETILIPEQTFTYRDDRFNWRTLAQEDVTVYWTGNDANLGAAAWQIVAESRQTLDQILPPTAVSPLNLYIYPATADLRAGLRLAGRDLQAGHVDPDLGVVLVTAVNPLTAAADLRQSIPHELVHLRLHQLAPTVTLPFWYEEGLALLVAGAGRAAEPALAAAVANNSALTLLTLCTNFPQESPEAELALAQSVSLLRTIQARFGNQALRQLGVVYLAGAGCEAGLTQTLDMSLAELNVTWLAAQAPQPAWRTFLGQNGLWLLLVAGSFGLLALILRR